MSKESGVRAALLFGAVSLGTAHAQTLQPSPGWAGALPPGPDVSVKITEEYAKLVARDAYFWAWPLANIYNRRLTFKDVPEIMMSGPVPIAPPNRLGMLTDYIEPDERVVACPNQDVVYGAGSLALDLSPVVIQVPDFGDRFWVYQMVDLRTDGIIQLGKMYGTTPGFLYGCRPELGRRNAQGDNQGFSGLHQHGFRCSACVSGRHAGGQAGRSGRSATSRDVPAFRV